MMKKRKIDLLNILKYGMVVVFIVYIVFLLSREGGKDDKQEYPGCCQDRRDEEGDDPGFKEIL